MTGLQSNSIQQNNTPSLPNFGRHAGRIGPTSIDGRIHIIGCGATGSYVADGIARMGAHKLDLWDADIVEPHNLANQRYDAYHVGMPKVEALRDVILRFNPAADVTIHNEFFTENSKLEEVGPVILTTDSMHSRKAIMQAVANNLTVDHVFETRLTFSSWEACIVDNFDPDSVTNFMAGLLSDDEVPEGPCNLKICPTNVMQCASFVIHQLCEMYVSRVNSHEWTSPRHQITEMSPKLTTMTIA